MPIRYTGQARTLADQMPTRALLVVIRAFGKVGQRIIALSPVDTGQFVMNWNPAAGQMDGTTVYLDAATHADKHSPLPRKARGEVRPGLMPGFFLKYGKGTKLRRQNRSGAQAEALRKLLAFLPTIRLGQMLYFTNALPYAQRLEHGWSRLQAPGGMVALTMAEFPMLVREAGQAMSAQGYGGLSQVTEGLA